MTTTNLRPVAHALRTIAIEDQPITLYSVRICPSSGPLDGRAFSFTIYAPCEADAKLEAIRRFRETIDPDPVEGGE
jgi:hypothetical protein